MYERPPKTFSELLRPFPDGIKDLAELIRKAILDSVPGLTETVYGGKKVGNALYSLENENDVYCAVQPDSTFVRLYFHNWQELKKAGFSLDGSGKHARHTKLRNASDLGKLDLPRMLEIVSDVRQS